MMTAKIEQNRNNFKGIAQSAQKRLAFGKTPLRCDAYAKNVMALMQKGGPKGRPESLLKNKLQ